MRQVVSGYYDDLDDGYSDRRRCTGHEDGWSPSVQESLNKKGLGFRVPIEA